MSRFAVVYEDPEYDDLNWAEAEAEWEDSVAEKQQKLDQWGVIEDPHVVDI